MRRCTATGKANDRLRLSPTLGRISRWRGSAHPQDWGDAASGAFQSIGIACHSSKEMARPGKAGLVKGQTPAIQSRTVR